ncbi:hypothetical protein [Hydrogenimonas sp.]
MLISIDIDSNGIKMKDVEEESTFKDLNLKEKDIEEFLRKNIETIFIDEDLLIVGQQTTDTQNGRSDLIAVDSEGNLVLIEIKRDKDDASSRKEPLEIQAIRYAASLAMIQTPDELADKIYQYYIKKDEISAETELTSNEKAKRKLNAFLKSCNIKNSFNSKQRIVLISSSFDEYTLSAVSWLISNNVDISCYGLKPIKIGEEIYIEVDKILPPKKLEDYYTGIKNKQENIKEFEKTGITRTTLPKMKKLFDWGIIKKGDKIKIKDSEDSTAIVEDYKYVKYKDKKLKFNEWGQMLKGWSSINIYRWSILEERDKTLDELRQEKIKELE